MAPKEQSPTFSDIAMREALGSPLPPPKTPEFLKDGGSRQMSHYQRFKQMEEEDYDAYYDAKYGKFGSLGRKESMGRYRKYQPAKSTEPGIMGSPRLVHRNLKLQPHHTPVHQQVWPLT